MDTLTKQELERLTSARMYLLEMHPFWGYLLLQMKFIPSYTLPTYAATDLVRHIWFNPRKTAALTMKELCFLLLHEISHQLLLNAERERGRDHFLWNQATDYVINDMILSIRDSGWNVLYDMPEGGLYDPDFAGLVAESVYEILEDEAQDDVEVPEKNNIMVKVFLPGESALKEGEDGDEGEDGENKNNGMGISITVCDHGGNLDVHLPLELDADDKAEILGRVNAAIENYNANDKRGAYPAEFIKKLSLNEKAVIPWQRVLARYVDKIISEEDYSLARPNKRLLVENYIVPGKYGEKISNIVIALDTSGSMTHSLLLSLTKEITGMLPEAEEITLIVADAKIHAVIPTEQLEKTLQDGKFSGGGGTDHVCVFQYIQEKRLSPVLFIGITDLDSEFPEKAPPYPVLWLAPRFHEDAPWGKVIEL